MKFGIKTRLTTQPSTAYLSTWMGRSPIESVQYFTISLANGVGQGTVTITSADPNRSRLFWLGSHGTDNSGAEKVDDSISRVSFTNATTITGDRGDTEEACVIQGCVVTYRVGVIRSVQRGTISGATTATINAVNVNKALPSYLGISVTDATSLMGNWTLTNATTITSTQGDVSGVIQGYEIAEGW